MNGTMSGQAEEGRGAGDKMCSILLVIQRMQAAGMVEHVFNPSTQRRQKQVNLCKFQANLIYIVS